LDNRLDIDRSSYNVRAYGPRPVNGSLNGHYHPAQSDKPSSGLSVIALDAFMTQQLAPREMVLDPIIAVRSLCLLFAYRGIGKTMVAFNIAWAIACGGRFLRWSSPKPRRVLYVDGEMPQQLLQERARTMIEDQTSDRPRPTSSASCRSIARSSVYRSIWRGASIRSRSKSCSIQESSSSSSRSQTVLMAVYLKRSVSIEKSRSS
jgi:AAA domain